MDHSLSGLQTVRKLLNISAQELADRLGIALQSYYRHERGERRIYLDKALVLSQTLEVPIEMLTREITSDERMDLFRRGEAKRALLESAQGDVALAGTLASWHDDEGDEA